MTTSNAYAQETVKALEDLRAFAFPGLEDDDTNGDPILMLAQVHLEVFGELGEALKDLNGTSSQIDERIWLSKDFDKDVPVILGAVGRAIMQAHFAFEALRKVRAQPDDSGLRTIIDNSSFALTRAKLLRSYVTALIAEASSLPD